MKIQANNIYDSPEISMMIMDQNAVLCSSADNYPQSATTEEWEEITL